MIACEIEGDATEVVVKTRELAVPRISIVTFVPSRAKTCENSSKTTPAPMITIRFGGDCRR